jgi:type IV secretion system protein VirD4
LAAPTLRKDGVVLMENLLADLPRGDPDRHPLGLPPGELFVRSSDIACSQTLAYQSGKIFLGLVGAEVSGARTRLAARSGKAIGINDDRHMVTIAGSRAGKGRAAVIPNMLHYPGSVLAIDPKGELAAITARQRSAGLGQDVYVLDPFGVAGDRVGVHRAGFNPIATMADDTLIEDAALIADALVVPSGNDPHWDESARNFIEGVILYVRLEHARNASLATVRNITSRGEQEPDGSFSMPALDVRMRYNRAADSPDHYLRSAGNVMASAAADFFDRPEAERNSVLSTVRRHLKFLDYPGISESVSSHGFALKQLKERPTTIYLCLPARHIGTCARWLRLFVNLTLQAMERTPGGTANGLPVLCCLDEFASLGHMRQIEDAAGQIAGFGVKLWPILQDLGQLKALYKDRWETFLGNAGILQFFGNNDLTTLEWITRRCDKTSIRTRQDSPVTGRQSSDGATGVNWKTEVHDLISIAEAARLFGRYDPQLRQLIILAGYPPLILQRAFYDIHDLFVGQYDEVAK